MGSDWMRKTCSREEVEEAERRKMRGLSGGPEG